MIKQVKNMAIASMEITISSTTNYKWALCIFASFLSCFILLLCIHHNQVALSLRSSFVPTSRSVEAFVPTSHSVESLEKPSHVERAKSLKKPSQVERAKSLKKPSQVERAKSLKKTNHVERAKSTKCNMFEGRWVYKPLENPMYKVTSCPFLSDQVKCQWNGRPDVEYQKWSWEANGCAVSSFDAVDMLERLRGKRVIMVGDSLNINQWESLACLLYSAIPPSRAHVSTRGSYKVFKAKDYKVSVEFYWSPFLVQLDSNHANNAPKLLLLDKIEASSNRWKGADVMVFNSGHWWGHKGRLKAWDSFQYMGKPISNEMKAETAFEIGMRTWASWVDNNVDPAKTIVFFRSISPGHYGKNRCHNKTKPLSNDPNTTKFPNPLVQAVERTIQEMRTPVKYLNITQLSQYRIDAYPAVYTTKKRKDYHVEKRLKLKKTTIVDCSHWCLPGLPDTWNRLLYASLLT